MSGEVGLQSEHERNVICQRNLSTVTSLHWVARESLKKIRVLNALQQASGGPLHCSVDVDVHVHVDVDVHVDAIARSLFIARISRAHVTTAHVAIRWHVRW